MTKALLDTPDPNPGQGPPGVAEAGPVLHRDAPLEGRRRRLRQGHAALHQERRPAYLLFLKGALAERQKHYEPAEQFFRQALDLDPNSAMTLNYLGYMLADKGVRLPEALKLIRKAVELDPMNGAYLDSLGWAYFKLGQYEEAEENLRQAVERDQTDPAVHDHLGELYEKTGRIRLAAAQWELSLAGVRQVRPSDIEPGEVAKVQRKLEAPASSWPSRTTPPAAHSICGGW
jgi:tetratricopeptide (TPR) repeat protein